MNPYKKITIKKQITFITFFIFSFSVVLLCHDPSNKNIQVIKYNAGKEFDSHVL